MCLLQTKPASLPRVNEPGPTMGPVALWEVQAAGGFGGHHSGLVLTFPSQPLGDQVGDGSEGGIPWLSKWVCARLFDRATPRDEFSCTYNKRVHHLSSVQPSVLLTNRVESRQGACYGAQEGAPLSLGHLCKLYFRNPSGTGTVA